MPGMYVTIPIALFIALIFLAAFVWSVRKGQYEDPEKPKYVLLMDDDDDVDKSMQRKGSKAK